MPFASLDVGPRLASVPPIVGGCLKAALGHLGAGRADEAVECLAAAAVADIQQHQQTFLAGAPEAAFLGGLYEQALAVGGFRPAPRGNRELRRPCRLLYVLSSLVEGQAACANILRFLSLHDRTHFAPAVLVVEENTRRNPALSFLTQPDAPSAQAGAETLARMQRLSPVTILPARGTFVDGVRAGIQAARDLSPDLAVFVASPACPIQAGMAFARVGAAQAVMNIGVPLVLRGVDAVIYNNPSRQEADRAFLEGRGVGVHGVETSGGDASSGAAVTPRARGALGIPSGARITACVSNALARRMLAGTFAADLGAFLALHPNVWWIGVGPVSPADAGHVRSTIESAGGVEAASRCIFHGPAGDPREVVKAADMLLNEYPEGGGNSVIEAMGCGTPVVAMRAGTRHAECIGAALVGDDAIHANDRSAYWRLAARWLSDEQERRAAAERQRLRALAKLDYAVICRAYEDAFRAVASAAPAPVP